MSMWGGAGRHDRRDDIYVTVVVDLTPDPATGPDLRVSDRVVGRSERVLSNCTVLIEPTEEWRRCRLWRPSMYSTIALARSRRVRH